MAMDRALVRDIALAVGIAALAMVDAILGDVRLTVVDTALVITGSLVIAARHHAPRTVLLISLLCILAYTVRTQPGPVATVPVLIAIYTVTAAGHRVFATAVVVPLMAFAVAGNLAKSPAGPPAQAIQAAILPVGWFVAAYVIGETTRHRRAHLHEARQRALEAERTREALALRGRQRHRDTRLPAHAGHRARWNAGTRDRARRPPARRTTRRGRLHRRSGFLVKDIEPADLITAVHTAVRGDALLSPTITRRLIDEFLTRPPRSVGAAVLDVLTPREREVVALVARGLSNDEIARQLVVSPTTAKTHVSRAMQKLGARDRAQLVVLAYETGLVSPG